MKLSNIFACAALAIAAPAFVSADDFAVYEGDLLYDSESTEALTPVDYLYLDATVKDAYNEAHAGEDFEADAVDASDIVLLTRRALGAHGHRQLPNTEGWGGVIRIGGYCRFCLNGNRMLKGGNQRKLSDDPATAALACNKLATGTNSKFHSATKCQISLLLIE